MQNPLTKRLTSYYKYFILGVIGALGATVIFSEMGVASVVLDVVLILYFIFRYYILFKTTKEAESLKVTLRELLRLKMIGGKPTVTSCNECPLKSKE